jgi:acyl carrier protein
MVTIMPGIDAIDERVRQIVEEMVKDATGVTEVAHASTYEELKIDSLTAIEIVLAIEEEYRIEIPDEDIQPEKIASVSELAAYVKTRVIK